MDEDEYWSMWIRSLSDSYKHRRVGRVWLFDWEDGFPMDFVYLSDEEKRAGHPKKGDVIAFDSGIPGDAKLAWPRMLKHAGLSIEMENTARLDTISTLRRLRIRRDVWAFYWTPEFPMDGVLVTEEDRKAGSPKKGDWIAFDTLHPEDRLFLLSKETFERYYEIDR